MFQNRFKLKLFLIFLFSFCFNLFSFAQSDDFEGKIKIKITGDGDDMIMDYSMKDGKMRMEIPGEDKGAMIFDGENTSILMTSQKMYMQFNYEAMKDKMEAYMDSENKTDYENIEHYKTGLTKEIMGHKCEQWIFDEDDSKVEAWVATDMGNFMMLKSPMGGDPGPGWSSMFEGKGFFPMLVITSDEDGDVESKFEVVEINKSSLSEDLFKIPAGYTKMNIPGM